MSRSFPIRSLAGAAAWLHPASFILHPTPALAYLFLPGHPLSWLPGLPLSPLSLAALVLFCLVLWATWPAHARRDVGADRSSAPEAAILRLPSVILRSAQDDSVPTSDQGRQGWRDGVPTLKAAWRFLTLLALLCLAKLLLAALAPAYGLQASYYGKPSARSAPPEWSSAFPALGATRLDRELSFSGDRFPLYFFNDNLRFNYYQEHEPDRATLPFNATWRGLLDVPADGDYRLWLTAVGAARLTLGDARLDLDSAPAPRTVEHRLRLAAGQHEIALDYSRPAGAPAELAVEWDLSGLRQPLAAPYLLAAPTQFPTTLATPLLWLARGLDALYLLTLAALALFLLRTSLAVRVRPTLDAESTPDAPRSSTPAFFIFNSSFSIRAERPLLAAFLAAVFLYGALSSADLQRRTVLLEGGQDWLTYETYARDILQNGPLMTLGRAVGKGRPYFFQPFYPYALAAWHALAGEDLYGVVVLQVFGGGVAAVLVYLLARRLFGRPAALLALAYLVGVLGPLQFDWVARRLLSENLYFWLLPAAALALLHLADRPSKRLALLAGALLGLACITRGPTLLWVPPALLLTYLRLRHHATFAPSRVEEGTGSAGSLPPLLLGRGGRGEGVSSSAPHPVHPVILSNRPPPSFIALAALACALVVALVPLRNYVVSGQPSIVASNGMSTMELAHPLTPQVDLRGAERNPAYRALRLDRSVIQVLEFIRQDPLGYAATLLPLGLYALGLPAMLEDGSPPRWELLVLIALYGVYLARAARRRRSAPPPPNDGLLSSPPSLGGGGALLHSFIALHVAIMMVFLPNAYGYRQVLPMYLFIAPFAAQVVAGWLRGLRPTVRGLAGQQARHRQQRHPVEQYVPGAGPAAGHEELA